MLYNSRMEQHAPQVVYMERNAPKRVVIRSDGALYVLLLLGTFAAIALGHLLAKRFGINRLYVQIGLYATLLCVGYLIYRTRLIDYVYELTGDALIVKQAVGNRQKQIVSVPFCAIREVGPYRKTEAKPEPRTHHGSRAQTTAVWFERDSELRVVLLCASDALKEKLTEADHAGE